MSGSVQLKLGDMFNGPSDMIVLPCSTAGTITTFVQNRISHFQIPYPPKGMQLGDIHIMPFTGAENIAQYVAYAASVLSHTSRPDAIERIGRQIGDYTSKNSSVRLVVAPLLGAGAGGLSSETVVEALRNGFLSTALPAARLMIYILHQDVFDRLKRHFEPSSRKLVPREMHNDKAREEHIRIFISYTKTSDQHQKWVVSLATFLRQNGVEARLDIWNLRHGMYLPQFMANELTLADRVIIISNEEYAMRADGILGGVGWETLLIQGDLFKLPPNSTKYLTIVRCENLDSGLPWFLKAQYVMGASL